MKNALYIIGVGLIVSSVAMTIYFFGNKKKEHKECSDLKKYEKKQLSVVETPPVTTDIAWEKNIYENVKSAAYENMYLRHGNAADIIKDSAEAICKNIQVSEGIGNEIDKVSDELDKMLSED